MTAKPTPTLTFRPEYDGFLRGPDDKAVAQVFSFRAGWAELGRLLAAAPDTYAACVDLCEAVRLLAPLVKEMPAEVTRAFGAGLKAVAKAEGRTP